MNPAEKNRESWNAYSDKYYQHADRLLHRIKENPVRAFHSAVWELIGRYAAPGADTAQPLAGKRICVPSSGDNHAVLAFAMLGARVTSCDISEKQLENAKRAAERIGAASSIDFVQADTMKLDRVENDAFDFVYTSNGVHVWINDLKGMYRNIYRIMKPGGVYLLYEIHPFQRPFTDSDLWSADCLRVQKPYDCTGPFEDETDICFHWRMQDILNALLDSGMKLSHIEELTAEKDYDDPFWLPNEDAVNGVTATIEEVDRMHDWRFNPMAALPNWLCAVGTK